jgi:hemerythrin-like domain-containing protein
VNIIIRELRADHHNIARLLVLMRNSIALISEENLECEIPNIRKCAEYLMSYPDEIHHPKEDILFNRLKYRDTSSSVYIENLLAEHRLLSHKSQEFYELVREIEENQKVAYDNLKMVSVDYIDTQFRHMRYEEASIFPLIEQKLTLSDWKSVLQSLPSGEDPLFNENRNAHFDSLYSQLSESFQNSKEQ